MSETIIAPVEQTAVLPNRGQLRERGMATVEYALGVIVVIVLIGVIIAAIQTGTFGALVEQLIEAVMTWVTGMFDNPFSLFKK